MTLRFKDGDREKVDKDNRRLRKADCARVTAKRTSNLAEREKVLFIDRRLLGVPGCAIPQRNESRGEGPFCVCRVAEDEREMFVYWIDACERPAPVPHFHSSFSFTPFSLSLSPHPKPLIMPSFSFRNVFVISLLGAFPFPSSSFLAHFQMAIKRFHPRNFTKGFNLQLPKGEKDEK
jgi:hypothetical protein